MKSETLLRTGMAALLTAVIVTVAPCSHATTTDAADTAQKKVESAQQNQAAADSRWNIWNWFEHEGDAGGKVPVHHDGAKDGDEGFSGQLIDFRHEIDRIFNKMFRDSGMSSFNFARPFSTAADGTFKPSLDLSAGDKEYTVTVELPGAKKDEIKVDIVDNVMTISGEKKQEQEEKDKNYYRQERYFGEFKRVLALPDDADQDGIEADFKQGVLTVTIPRKPMPKSKVKEVEIHS
jgi:HSP20 family protein